MRGVVVWILCSAAPLAAQTAEPFVRGDVTGDEQVTALDALAALSSVVGKVLPSSFRAYPNGDADCNDVLSAADALIVLSAAVRRDVSSFCVGLSDVSGAVGATGGTVAHPGGATVNIPPGVLVDVWRVSVQTGLPVGQAGSYVLDMARLKPGSPSGLEEASSPATRAGDGGQFEFVVDLQQTVSSMDEVDVEIRVPGDELTYLAHSSVLLAPGNRVANPIHLPASGKLNARFTPRISLELHRECDWAYSLGKAVEDQGSDPGRVPVVFVHGWQRDLKNCQDWADFDAQAEGSEVFKHIDGRADSHRLQYWRFTYPTFRSVRDAGDQLARRLKAQFADRADVVLIAHSMGGLVARSAIESYGADAVVARVVTLGTPHSGSPMAEPDFWVSVADKLGVAEWVMRLAAPLSLNTDGAKDLKPSSRFVAELDSAKTWRGRYHTIGGDVSAEGLSGCGLQPFKRCLAYELMKRAYEHSGVSRSDAVVPLASALLEGAYQYRSLGIGYNHSELIEGNFGSPAGADPVLAKVAELARPMGGPPPPPGPLQATPFGSFGIALAWSDESDSEEGFVVETGRAENGPFTQVEVPANVTRMDQFLWPDALGPWPGTRYYFRVASRGAGATSPYLLASASTLSTLPQPNSCASATVVQGVIYTFGECHENSVNSRVRSYDPSTDEWSERRYYAGPPTNISSYGNTSGAVVIGDKVYVTGGSGWGHEHSSLYIYEPARDAWTLGPDHPIVTYSGVAGTIEGRLYVYTPHANTFFMFDPSLQAWTVLSAPPGGRRGVTGGVVGSRFYIVGGHDPTTNEVSAQLHVYDAPSGIWSAGPPMLVGRSGARAAISDGRIYVVGGRGCGPSCQFEMTRGVEEYDPGTSAWSTVAELRLPRMNAATVAIGSRLYVLGGWLGSGSSNHVEVVDLPPPGTPRTGLGR